MSLLCLKCHNTFESGTVKGETCPCRGCGGEIADVDELMIPAIVTLKNRGYYPKFSCSGHYGGPMSDHYISFAVPHVSEIAAEIAYEWAKSIANLPTSDDEETHTTFKYAVYIMEFVRNNETIFDLKKIVDTSTGNTPEEHMCASLQDIKEFVKGEHEYIHTLTLYCYNNDEYFNVLPESSHDPLIELNMKTRELVSKIRDISESEEENNDA